MKTSYITIKNSTLEQTFFIFTGFHTKRKNILIVNWKSVWNFISIINLIFFCFLLFIHILTKCDVFLFVCNINRALLFNLLFKWKLSCLFLLLSLFIMMIRLHYITFNLWHFIEILMANILLTFRLSISEIWISTHMLNLKTLYPLQIR